MTTIQTICEYLEQLAPSRLAEEWDNVGLLVGDPVRPAARVMTCLTVTPASAGEAVREHADLIVTHHPLPFHPLKRLTTETTTGRLLLGLISSGVAVYSAHTAFDSAATGINQRLAEGLQLADIAPLRAIDNAPDGAGAGRCGRLPEPTALAELAERIKAFLHLAGLHLVGEPNHPVQRVAIACGAAGEFLDPARRAGCDVLVTGETNFHTCLEAEATRVGLLLTGHYASERFGVEGLADDLAREFPEVEVWASGDERDPLRWV
jgi:dinuclear metal center YbgI/SA1388 family protein